MPDAKRFVPEIVRLTRDKEASVRIEAALTLSYLKPAEAVPVGPLNDLLGDSVPEVRITALESLERIAPRKALESAIERLRKDPEESVRQAAEQAREHLGEK